MEQIIAVKHKYQISVSLSVDKTHAVIDSCANPADVEDETYSYVSIPLEDLPAVISALQHICDNYAKSR